MPPKPADVHRTTRGASANGCCSTPTRQSGSTASQFTLRGTTPWRIVMSASAASHAPVAPSA
jgi:hypothetical protein